MASPQYCQIMRYAGSLVTLFIDLVYVIFNLSDHTNYNIVTSCVGVSGTTQNSQKEEWQLGGRSIYKYVAIFLCIEVYHPLPVTKGINFKSGKSNEQNEVLKEKCVFIGKEHI